jgi:hypothetical protein
MLLPLVLFYQKHMEQRGAIMWSQQNQIRERTQPSNELIRDGAKLMQLLYTIINAQKLHITFSEV